MTRNTQAHPYAHLNRSDWWYPQDLSQEGNDRHVTLNASQVAQFRHDVFLVVDGLWSSELIQKASDEARRLHPSKEVAKKTHSGSNRGFSAMPWTQSGEKAPEESLNQMSVYPRALAAAAQLMETETINIRLSQSHVIAKHGHSSQAGGVLQIEGDQDIHVDYGNNTLLVPPRTTAPEAVACLCYYSNVEESGGSTHFAKASEGELTTYEPETFNPPNFVIGTNNGSAAISSGPRSIAKVNQRYTDEKPVYYKPGTCILYRLDAWHRGTPAALNTTRYTHHHVWRHREAEWINWQSLAPRLANMPGRYLESLSVVQRTVLGFAAPGDRYWTAETIDSVGQRYPGMNMGPYREAMNTSSS